LPLQRGDAADLEKLAFCNDRGRVRVKVRDSRVKNSLVRVQGISVFLINVRGGVCQFQLEREKLESREGPFS